MTYDTLLVEAADGVTLIRLNRPRALNALNQALLGELVAALGAGEADDAVRCFVITGSEKAFAAGADITEMAPFRQPEINLGVVPGIGGTQRLPRAVGKSMAMDMILTARMIDAVQAERAGLVSRVVPAARLMEEAMEAARKIAAQSPLAVMMAKELVMAAYETPLTQGARLERRLFHSLFAFDDQKEGMAAFSEKRPAAFKGS